MTDSIPAALNAVTGTPTAAIHNKAKKVNHGEIHAPHPTASTTVTLSSAGMAAAAADIKPAELPAQIAVAPHATSIPAQSATVKQTYSKPS